MQLEQKVKIINFFSLIVIGLILVVMSKGRADWREQQTEIDALKTRIAADQVIGSSIPELQRAVKVLKQKNTDLRGEIEETKQERAVEQGRNQALREDLKRCAAQLRGKTEEPE